MRAFVSFFRASFLWVLLLPTAVSYVGEYSNQLVLWANHDTFPVYMRSSAAIKLLPDEQGHVLMSSETHLNILADVFDVGDGWESIGDKFLATGAWLHIFCPYMYILLVTRQLVEDNSARKR
jgi:hypothetical protein